MTAFEIVTPENRGSATPSRMPDVCYIRKRHLSVVITLVPVVSTDGPNGEDQAHRATEEQNGGEDHKGRQPGGVLLVRVGYADVAHEEQRVSDEHRSDADISPPDRCATTHAHHGHLSVRRGDGTYRLPTRASDELQLHTGMWGWSDETTAWMGLGATARHEVRLLAREGRAHPDPQVARIAYEWARWSLRRFPTYRLVQIGVALFALGTGVAYLLTGAGLTPWLLFAALPLVLLSRREQMLQEIATANDRQ